MRRLAETLPPGCRVTILADRGFGDQKLFAFLTEVGFGYVIRFRGNIRVTDADGDCRPASEWVGKGGRARKLRDARITAQGRQVGAVVCVHAKGMKEPWCLSGSAGTRHWSPQPWISAPASEKNFWKLSASGHSSMTMIWPSSDP